MPEIDFTPKLTPLPPVKMVYTVASKSDPSIAHFTFLFEDGSIDCTCTGWKMQKKCWHVHQVREMWDVEEEFDVSL